MLHFANESLYKKYKYFSNKLNNKYYSNSIIMIGLFVFFYLFYYHTLSYFVPLMYDKYDYIYHADTMMTLGRLMQLEFLTDHLLFSALSHPFVLMTVHLFHTTMIQAIILVLATFAAINILLAYFALNFLITDKKLVILYTFFYGFLFSNLVIFSIPETYVLTVLFILIYFNSLIRFKKSASYLEFILLILVAVLPSLLYPPFLLIMILNTAFFLRIYGIKRGTIMSVLGALMMSLIFISAYYLLHPLQPYWNTGNGANFQFYFERYASLMHFLNLNDLSNVFGNFLLFSVVSPSEKLSASLNFIEYFPEYFHSVIGIVLILSYISSLGIFSYYIAKNRDLIRDSLLLFILILISFSIYFNPQEAILYSCTVTFPLTLIFADITSRITVNKKYIYISLLLFIILLFIRNVNTLYYPIYYPI